jgi:hypothetical protein
MAPATAEKKKGGSLLFSFGRSKAEKAKAGEYLRLPGDSWPRSTPSTQASLTHVAFYFYHYSFS